MRQRYVDLIARQARARQRPPPRRRDALACASPSTSADSSRSRRRCCRSSTAAPRPGRSSTHINAYDIDLYLRIAPELFLKRAVVGGIEKVFEINRNFRNEGADSSHSPEFAMLEAYEAYGDYDTMAVLTRELVQGAANDVFGAHHRRARRRRGLRPRRRLDRAQHVRLAVGGARRGDHAADFRWRSSRSGATRPTSPWTPSSVSHGKLVEELWEHHVGDDLVRADVRARLPGRDLPAHARPPRDRRASSRSGTCTCAVSSSPPRTPSWWTRSSSASASSSRRARRRAATTRPCCSTRTSSRPWSTRCRPSGGMGMGIDRLLMALTGLGIRETILFPLVKPTED